MNASLSDPKSQLIIQDNTSGLQFLIDTGAQVSVIPATWQDRRARSTGPSLQAANGTRISTFGTRDIVLKLGRHSYSARLVLADVRRPLLGADFLRTHGLLVDVRGRRLVQAETLSPIVCLVSRGQGVHLATSYTTGNQSRDVITGYPELLQPTFSADSIRHSTTHHIQTDGPSVFSKVRRLSPEKLEAARTEFQHMEAMGIIQKSNSPWSSPLHMASKSDGS